MIFQFDQSVNVRITNFNQTPSIVVMLPITRTSTKARANWFKILKILENSEVSSLIILDKTLNAEASSYFKDFFKFEHINLYIVRRPPNEPIYDSQGYVSLDTGLWILQLHDDDEWDGSLSIPKNAQKFELFSTNFYFLDSAVGKSSAWENSPPARINFTLIPSLVWNKFVEFIESQGGHVAGSVDSTLNLVSRLICKHQHLSMFSYTYDNRHWQNRKVASKNLIKLAKQDGWLRLASVEIQLLNRNIDNLVAVRFFENLIPSSKIENAISDSLKNFKPNLKRKFLTLLNQQIFSILEILAHLFGAAKISSTNEKLLSKIEARLTLHKLVRRSWEITNEAGLVEFIQNLKESLDSPLLADRFAFWEATLKS